jgi:hypothetical protein
VKSGTNTLKVFISTKRKGKLNFEFNKGWVNTVVNGKKS